MSEEKTLEEKMLEAIRHAHWQSNPSESKIAARNCAILSLEDSLEYLKYTNSVPGSAQVFIDYISNRIQELKNTP